MDPADMAGVQATGTGIVAMRARLPVRCGRGVAVRYNPRDPAKLPAFMTDSHWHYENFERAGSAIGLVPLLPRSKRKGRARSTAPYHQQLQ